MEYRDEEQRLRAAAAQPLPDTSSVEEAEDLLDDEESENTGDEERMYEHFRLTVDRGQAMLRIDKFLTCRMESASRNRIQTAADAGNILVNGVAVKSSYRVKPMDQISIVMPYPLRELEIIPENIPLDIPYEDEDLIIVNKPAGMVVHPGHGNYSGTLVNALTYHLKDLPLFQSGDMRAGLVHRIDKNTSGILVVAKNERAHARLAKQFFDHSIHRIYHALVWGNMEQ
ncbi:MAG: RluA family pseudouridine synthase, partial [Alistipes sp.]|nr:RluA family pseudouridine synthase [Alistipes sp.]